MGLQTSSFGEYLLSNMDAEKNGKPLKQKCVQIQKQNVNSYSFEVADDEYGHILVVRCVICRKINGNNGNNGKLV